ncbi:hypothetical protein J2M53_09975 [Arthrobacter sp. zg-ZUI100]|uniref:hypothetical protein n=1 Tax=Arthrobacter jiangjiafuii TaxID=2817475 RepID=UPI001AED4BB0|nr:hypothetical protein [Arthrobacter jiangjiafuii]MBP3036577.1 hypothetical protein [Arthrobacter jiangjiafuii]
MLDEFDTSAAESLWSIGSVSHATPDLEQVLGRKPRAMSDYISRTADAGSWRVTEPAAGLGASR